MHVHASRARVRPNGTTYSDRSGPTRARGVHALLADAFRGRDRGAAFGVFGAVTGVAVAGGPVLGGAITSGLSWRWIFSVNLPIGALALAVTVARVGESRDPRAARPDLGDFATFSLGLAALVFGLIAARPTDGDRPPSSPRSPAAPRCWPRSVSSNAGSAARCWTCGCCGCPRSTAGWPPPGRSPRRCSRC